MIYFISDVHLGILDRKADKIRENLLLNILNLIKKDCKTLVLLGDIFDYWFDYKLVVPKYFYRTLTELHNFAESGIEIIYLMGNHDFGHRTFFREELGIDVIKTDIEREFYGKKFYLSHGDGKAYYDGGYLLLKKVLRNNIAQKMFLSLHPDFGMGIASSSSKKSRNYTDKKDYGANEGMRDFALKKIEEGFDYVVMGHRHRAEIIKHNAGYYINLGEWIRKPHYGKFDGTTFDLIKLTEF